MIRVELGKELDFATELAREAGKLLLWYSGSERIDSRGKGARDVVTAADLAAERLIVAQLRASFPDDGIIAEEGTEVSSGSGRSWYIDPLDGTMNFSRGIPIWCVSVGLLDGDGPLVGVIYDPIRGELFRAARGAGAALDGTTLHVSSIEVARDAVVHLTIDFNERSMLEGLEDVSKLAPQVLRTRNIGSAALALAYLAAGRLDAMLHRYANTWDYVAGVLLIEEAGGVVTDLTGGPFTAATDALLASSTAPLHQHLLSLLR